MIKPFKDTILPNITDKKELFQIQNTEEVTRKVQRSLETRHTKLDDDFPHF